MFRYFQTILTEHLTVPVKQLGKWYRRVEQAVNMDTELVLIVNTVHVLNEARARGRC